MLLTVFALLLPTTSPAAATSPEVGPTALDVWYSAGDSDPSAGPNSFHIVGTGDCVADFVRYAYNGRSEMIRINCNVEQVESIAPLGPTAYPMTWSLCYYYYWRYPPRIGIRCDSTPNQDFVHTT